MTSVAAEHAGGLEPAAPDGPVARSLTRASASDYPLLFAARQHLLSGSGEQRFAWAVEVLLHGIVHGGRARSAPARKPRPTSNKARKKS